MSQLSPQATQAVQPGQVVVDLGRDIWLPWNQISLTAQAGCRIAVALTGAVPGQSFATIVSGPVPVSLFSLGAGRSTYVIAGVVPARQLMSGNGQVIGYCDPSGTIEVYPSYVGATPFTLLPPSPFGGVSVAENGSQVLASTLAFNFTGGYATVTDSSGTAQVDIPEPESPAPPASVGLSSARPSATGSGVIYVCSDAPVMYVDDPTTEAWQQIGVADTGLSTAPGAAANWTAIDISLVQKADTLLAIQADAYQSVALKTLSSAGLSGSGSWAAYLTCRLSLSTNTTATQGGICVTNGTTSGTSTMYALGLYLNPGTNAGWLYASAVTIGGTNGWSTATAMTGQGVPWTGAELNLRVLSDGTDLYFQFSNGGVHWRTFSSISLPSGLTNYGFAVSSAGTSSPSSTMPGAMLVDKCYAAAVTQVAVSGGSGNGTTSTIDTVAAHGLVSGMFVTIRGLSGGTGTLPNGGEYVITVTGASSFTFASSDTWTYGSGGTVTATSI
jgi:hypothetical protein